MAPLLGWRRLLAIAAALELRQLAAAAPDEALASSLDDLGAMLDVIADESIARVQPPKGRVRGCKLGVGIGEVIAARELHAPGVAVVPKLTPGRVVRVGPWIRVAFHIAGTGLELALDVRPLDVCPKTAAADLIALDRVAKRPSATKRRPAVKRKAKSGTGDKANANQDGHRVMSIVELVSLDEVKASLTSAPQGTRSNFI